MESIVHLTRKQIDDSKWNACMANAPNGLVYGYTFYLDVVCTNWDGLVVNNYEAVMPLPWRTKWNIAYLYQPVATAQLGLFGAKVSEALLHGVLKNIPARFLYRDIPLNFGNRFWNATPFLFERKNFVLPLNQPYEGLAARYRTHIRRNIKKAVAHQCMVVEGVPVNAVLALAQLHKGSKMQAADAARFEKLYDVLHKKGWAKTIAVQSEKGEMLASAVFFFCTRRAYYILAGNSAAGRSTGASHYLIDAFIRQHAQQPLVLDFEGSDVPALQFYYSSFGALEEPYAALRHNKLPLLLRWLK